MYDTAIIGAGPAGLSAAINLKQLGKSFIWFGSRSMSAKVGRSEMIANYPGVPMVTGEELNRRFLAQADEMGIELTDKMVTAVSATRRGFMLQGDNDIFEARTVLLATGAVTAKGFPGEDALLGHGVSYCATCDGFLYPGKTIAVWCGAKRYEHEIEYLAGIAGKVWLHVQYDGCAVDLPNVERLPAPIAGITGADRVESVTLRDGAAVPVDGVFILRDAVAPARLIKGIELDGAHIVADRKCRTSKPGVFAAGDCTGRPYQIAKAVGEGNIAAHSIVEHLAGPEKE